MSPRRRYPSSTENHREKLPDSLLLQANHFTDEGLARLGGKDRLKRLYIGIGYGRITDAGLSHLRGFKSLELLDAQNSEVTARGLAPLVKDLPKLKELWLDGTRVTEVEKEAMREARPSLRIQ
jgi:hypothetical protein